MCQTKLIEKAYSYFCSDEEGCGVRIQKNLGGKHLFPEILARVLEAKGESIGPFTGVERPKAPCKFKLIEGGQVELEPEGDFPADEYIISEADRVEDGVVMGICPKCQTDVVAKGEGFMCSSEKCRFRLSKRLLFRVLPPDDVRKLLTGPNTETSLLEGFISRRGRPFNAHLYFDEKGGLKWKFPPRPKKASTKKKAKKKTKKKAAKKKL
jgi:DNA topoisomerase-3